MNYERVFKKKKPFYLNDEQLAFVEQTIESMSLDDKIGQLFLPINFIEEEQPLREFVRKFQPGGALNRPAPGALNQNRHRIMQEESKIPMFIPANIESGGNGTAVGEPHLVIHYRLLQPEIQNKYAYELGKIAGKEGRAVGINYAFAPIIDIDYNTLNQLQIHVHLEMIRKLYMRWHLHISMD